MVEVEFEYQDAFTNGNWSRQSCVVSSVDSCIKLYGLTEPGVKYRIISVKELDNGKSER